MKRLLRTLYLATAIATMLNGCAVYTGATVVSIGTTGKSLGDHTASLVTNADCNIWRASIELTYYCEYLREPGTTYNRNPY